MLTSTKYIHRIYRNRRVAFIAIEKFSCIIGHKPEVYHQCNSGYYNMLWVCTTHTIFISGFNCLSYHTLMGDSCAPKWNCFFVCTSITRDIVKFKLMSSPIFNMFPYRGLCTQSHTHTHTHNIFYVSFFFLAPVMCICVCARL